MTRLVRASRNRVPGRFFPGKDRRRPEFAQAKQAQSKFEHQQWADVRIVECWDLLIVETAMECVLRPYASSIIGYQLARKYAGKYDSRYGSGLIPKSAPMMAEIVEFWGRHFFGRGWRKVVGA